MRCTARSWLVFSCTALCVLTVINVEGTLRPQSCLPDVTFVSLPSRDDGEGVVQEISLCSHVRVLFQHHFTRNSTWSDVFTTIHRRTRAPVVLISFRSLPVMQVFSLHQQVVRYLDNAVLIAGSQPASFPDVFMFRRNLITGSPAFRRHKESGDASFRAWFGSLSMNRSLDFVDCSAQLRTALPHDFTPPYSNLVNSSDAVLLCKHLRISSVKQFLRHPCAFFPLCTGNSSWVMEWDLQLSRYLILARSQESLLAWSDRRMTAIKDIYLRKRCVVVGNGPSLNRMELGFLRNEVVFASNKIFLGFRRFNFTPQVYSAVNEYVLNQSIAQILDVPGIKVVPLKKFIPHAGLIFRDASAPKRHFQLDGRSLTQGSSVTYVLLQLAYWTGCSQVILIGLDHYFQQNGSPHERQLLNGSDPNHFSPDYFRDQPWQLAALQASEEHFRIALDMFQRDGRSVLDATVGGRCTVFPKVHYKDVFL